MLHVCERGREEEGGQKYLGKRKPIWGKLLVQPLTEVLYEASAPAAAAAFTSIWPHCHVLFFIVIVASSI